ncbi:MAG: dTDP-glucose 4,6-dehydratase, partial [Parcubacteria group bacterium Gr01-1014_70]
LSTSLRGEPLRLGSPDSKHDFIYVEDVVDAYLQGLGRAKKCAGEVYNIGNGREVSIADAAAEIQRVCGSKSVISWGSNGAHRSGESPRWQADIAKAKRDLLWEPTISFADGLEKTAKWFRIHASSYE